MDMTTLLVIVLLIVLLGGGGWYGHGRWYGRRGLSTDLQKEIARWSGWAYYDLDVLSPCASNAYPHSSSQ
jgi:hypothetical protein